MPGYTGILSPRTYLSSSLHLQLADSLFKPTFATFFSIYFNIQTNHITRVTINDQDTLAGVMNQVVKATSVDRFTGRVCKKKKKRIKLLI